MIHGKLVSNNSKMLIIIFQSAGRITDEMFEGIKDGRISENEIEEAHKKYTWYKFSEKNYADYLFIEDYFSQSYGWYMVDAGKSIIDDFNEELENFIKSKGYTSVTSFGSSKGGTGALLYGLMNPKIDNVYALVPQVHAVTYIEKHYAPFKSLFFPDNDKEVETYFNEIFFNESIYKEENYSNTNIYLYTGIGDEQYKETLQLNQFLSKKVKNNNIIINSSSKSHTPIVMDNIPFIRSGLKLIANRAPMEGPRLSNIREDILLLRDK